MRAAKESHRPDVAIIGMACIFPKAPDLNTYWHNILTKTCAITEVRPEHWDTRLYYEPDSKSIYRAYAKHGGFLDEPERRFRPLDYGVLPNSVQGGEPDHFLALRTACDALRDAGCLDNVKARSRTAVILGKGNYTNAGNMNIIQHGWILEQTLMILSDLHPEYTTEELEEIRGQLKASLPPFHTDIIPSLIPNVMTGRIANRLNLMGPNYTIDAACASSLIAVDQALAGLRSRQFDLALVGGVQGGNSLLATLVFCDLTAISPSGRVRFLDKDADGTVLGEGIGLVVLKRREDAERDGDRIYASVRGAGTSSDGKGTGLLAPRKQGERLALRRAYRDAGIKPQTIGLLEAHGTGTPVGDATEIEAIQEFFGKRKTLFAPCAVGSAKTLLGHLIPASGVAGIIKAALALYHKVLPPTADVEEPNPALDQDRGFFYINTKVRPWIHAPEEHPRRAGVNAFGFGGINAHVILEEAPEQEGSRQDHLLERECELVLIEAPDRAEISRRLEALESYLTSLPETRLLDLAHTLARKAAGGRPCLAIVAASTEDLRRKVSIAKQKLAEPQRRQIKDRGGIYYFDEPLDPCGRIVFLFPGEGAQYPDMLADLCPLFPAVRRCFDRTDRSFLKRGKGHLLSDAVFPRSCFRDEDRQRSSRLLWEIDTAVEAVFTANLALFSLLTGLGVRPSVLLGHSSGEYAALQASGMLDEVPEELVLEAHLVPEAIEKEGGVPQAGMLAIGADRTQVEKALGNLGEGLFLAMDNCPHQVILVGADEKVQRAQEELKKQRMLCEPLPFRRGYHTPLFRPVTERLRKIFSRYPLLQARVPVWSCTTRGPYPEDPDQVRRLMADHWVEPVAFQDTVRNLYSEGYRLFVEVGPRGNLAAFVEDILRGRPALALPSNLPRLSGLAQLEHLLAILAAQRIPLRLDSLCAPRGPRE
ncbi:MAG: type I polyketide synthase, partial [bacterium]